MIYKSILIISDTHIPYENKFLIPFLKALTKKYKKFDRVIHLGDEVDHAGMSFHDKDSDMPSAGDELRLAIPKIKELEKMFPKMDLLDSNHGSLVYRRAFKHGIPKAYIKNYNDYLQVGNGWKWHEDITLDTPLGKVYFCHGKTADVFKLAQSLGMSAVQGHYHSLYGCRYYGNSLGLYYGLQCGCLIDPKALAFKYNKLQKARPVIGTSVIINGIPILEPMILDKSGKWIGKLL
jgi:hypothetical protein